MRLITTAALSQRATGILSRHSTLRTTSLLLGAVFYIARTLAAALQAQTTTHTTVPFSVENNAPIVTLGFKRQDGTLRTARFILDSGGGAMIFDQPLATDLGLVPEGSAISSEGQAFERVPMPAAFVGKMPVDLRSSGAFIHLGKTSFDNRDRVEGLLPGKALEHYQVVLDYPKRMFSIGNPGTLPHQGRKLASPYIASSGHPRIEVEIDGSLYGFLLDTGSTFTLARADLLQRWSREHLDWPRSTGAAGTANEIGESDNKAFLLRVPVLQIAGFRVNETAMVSRPNETYSAASNETPAPIVGAVGGNVLAQFRVEIDYPEQIVFLEAYGTKQVRDLDTVGLVLSTDAVGRLVVSGFSSSALEATRRDIHVGDILVGITGLDKPPDTLTEAALALSGKAGERKQLRLLRDGAPVTVTVVVTRIL